MAFDILMYQEQMKKTYTVLSLIRKLILFKSSLNCEIAFRSKLNSSSVHLLLELNIVEIFT